MTSAAIVAVQYAAGVLTVTWTPGDCSSFSLKLSDTTNSTAVTYPVTGFSVPLTPTIVSGHNYTIAIATVSGGVIGSYGPAIPVLVAAPTVTKAQNKLTSIDLSWSAPTGVYTGAYVATLQLANQQAQSQPSTTTSTSFPLQTPPTGGNNTVSVQLQTVVNNATVNGPPTQYTLITQTPTLAKVDNSTSSQLTLMWSGPQGMTHFLATLQPAGASATTQPASGNMAFFPGPFPASSYTTFVCAISADGVAIGPPSQTYTPILAAPTMTLVENTGAGLKLTWSMNGITTFTAVKQQGSSSSSVPVTGTTYTFPGPLNGSGITCGVAASSADGVVIGPPSTTYTALVGRPLWNNAAYDAGQLALTWNWAGETGISGFLIEIPALTPDGYAVQGSTPAKTLPVTLVAMSSYPTTVRAVNGIVRGPPSPTLVPLTAPPVAPSLGYTGSALQLSWSASGEANVTGFSTELLGNGSSTETSASPASPGQFTAAFAAGTRFAGRVRATGAGTAGPWSSTASGPYKADLSYTFDPQGRLQSVAWAAGFTETYGFDSAGNLLTVSYAPTTSSSKPPAPAPGGQG